MVRAATETIGHHQRTRQRSQKVPRLARASGNMPISTSGQSAKKGEGLVAVVSEHFDKAAADCRPTTKANRAAILERYTRT